LTCSDSISSISWFCVKRTSTLSGRASNGSYKLYAPYAVNPAFARGTGLANLLQAQNGEPLLSIPVRGENRFPREPR
jgi:hypothetical protein